jgi:outer membrane biosynthesis protein TonB
MTIRIYAVLCFATAFSVVMAAQSEPVLVSANIPKHPPLACQARIEGFVKLSFTLAANAAEPTNVEVVSGHAMLKGAAMENVYTWRADGKTESTGCRMAERSIPARASLQRRLSMVNASHLPYGA